MEKHYVILLQAIILAGSIVTPNPNDILEMEKKEAEDLEARGVVHILKEEDLDLLASMVEAQTDETSIRQRMRI